MPFCKLWYAGIKTLTSQMWPLGLCLPTPELRQLIQKRSLGFGSKNEGHEGRRSPIANCVSDTPLLPGHDAHCYQIKTVIAQNNSKDFKNIVILFVTYFFGLVTEIEMSFQTAAILPTANTPYLSPSSWKGGFESVWTH